ncbi:hypothetical protein TELCIR_17131 [Teladorsagia circumcincta]|uniref:WD domain, G-beta repeat protein n=1 Tax=Teladorsagia circumcincta TaxID=45464 RepID=A0A2G9TTX3_TELCI|nr:hypothetical protein TELCIR_17131 [Teladorsagia circumcincta]
MDRWEKDGITGVIDHVANITEDSKLWPISRLGRRLALCQNNNYIRVYNIGPNQKTPLTLKHPLQNNVACMAWEPFDQRVLAVAANNKILIWRLSVKATNIKPSVRCAQVIELPAVPVSQIVWDRTTTNVLLAVSPNSSKIMIVDISTGEVDCFGAWTGGNITRIVPTNDGRRLAVLYTGNVIRRWTGDTCAVPIFDVSPVEFDPSELEVDGAVEREIVTIGGKIHNMTLSPDGQRLAVSFKENPPVVALFIVDWLPTVRFIPSGLVEAPLYGHPSIQFFLPKFSNGSLLAIVWSSGSLQYLPMLYGCNTSHFNSRSIRDEISGHSSPGIAHQMKRSFCSLTDSGRVDPLSPSEIKCLAIQYGPQHSPRYQDAVALDL